MIAEEKMYIDCPVPCRFPLQKRAFPKRVLGQLYKKRKIFNNF